MPTVLRPSHPLLMSPLRPLQLRWLHMLFATAAGVGAEAHHVSVSRNLTPAVAIVVAVEWGPLRMTLSVAIADCAGAMRLEIALLAMAVMLRLAQMHTQVASMHGPCLSIH